MRLKLLLVGLGILGAFACCRQIAKNGAEYPASKPAASAPAPNALNSTLVPASAGASGNTCVRCHQWDKVIAASVAYVTPQRVKGNPHIFVDLSGASKKPHDTTKDANIPDCLKCHTTHTLSPEPKKGDIDMTKVSVKWCYDACHHEKNFERCDKCH